VPAARLVVHPLRRLGHPGLDAAHDLAVDRGLRELLRVHGRLVPRDGAVQHLLLERALPGLAQELDEHVRLVVVCSLAWSRAF